jgi:hypothetical protein
MLSRTSSAIRGNVSSAGGLRSTEKTTEAADLQQCRRPAAAGVEEQAGELDAVDIGHSHRGVRRLREAVRRCARDPGEDHVPHAAVYHCCCEHGPTVPLIRLSAMYPPLARCPVAGAVGRDLDLERPGVRALPGEHDVADAECSHAMRGDMCQQSFPNVGQHQAIELSVRSRIADVRGGQSRANSLSAGRIRTGIAAPCRHRR